MKYDYELIGYAVFRWLKFLRKPGTRRICFRKPIRSFRQCIILARCAMFERRIKSLSSKCGNLAFAVEVTI